MKSALYEGIVFHERLMPKQHAFKYRVFMVYFSLQELPRFLSLSIFWSSNFFSLAKYKRTDFFGDKETSLECALKDKVYQDAGFRPSGDICVLANFRYFGFIMNPLITYYLFDKNDNLEAIVAEVSNTPWNERHAYVLDCRNTNGSFFCEFDKVFSVSPFNGMNMSYRWHSNVPGENLSISINTMLDGDEIVNAAINLKRKEVSTKVLNMFLLKYPLHTLKVISGIYWEALKLYIKKVPFLGKNKIIKPDYLEKV